MVSRVHLSEIKRQTGISERRKVIVCIWLIERIFSAIVDIHRSPRQQCEKSASADKKGNTVVSRSFHRPNVCSKIETQSVTKLVPCLKSYDHLVKVWSHNCSNGRRICPTYEHRCDQGLPTSISRSLCLFHSERNTIGANREWPAKWMSPPIIVVWDGHVSVTITVVL